MLYTLRFAAWSVLIGTELDCVTQSTCCVSLLPHSWLQMHSVPRLSSQLGQAAARSPVPAEQQQKLHMLLCSLQLEQHAYQVPKVSLHLTTTTDMCILSAQSCKLHRTCSVKPIPPIYKSTCCLTLYLSFHSLQVSGSMTVQADAHKGCSTTRVRTVYRPSGPPQAS